MTPRVAGNSLALLRVMLENESALTEEQRAATGRTARQLLAFAWDQANRNSWLVTNSLRSVCQTFGTDPEASAALLRRAVEPNHLTKFGYEEMRWITRELRSISTYDPVFVADVYSAVFSHEEVSTDPTDMSRSRILLLTSNKKQDYDHAKWELSECYFHFVETTPLIAAKAMLDVAGSYRRRDNSSQSQPEYFDFNGAKVGIIPDYSYLWMESFSSQNDDEVKILNAFFKKLEKLANDESRAREVDEIVRMLAGGVRPAIVWRRLLQLGTRHPQSVGTQLRTLACAAPCMGSGY